MKQNKEWINSLAAAAALLVGFASLYRIALTPGTRSVPGVQGLRVQNLGVGTRNDDIISKKTVIEVFSIGLGNGTYLVGEELPAGTYRVSVMRSGWSELCVYRDGDCVDRWENDKPPSETESRYMTWTEGQYLVAKGSGFMCTTIEEIPHEFSDYMGSYDPYECVLSEGRYRVGSELPEGNYTFYHYGDEPVTLESSRSAGEGGVSVTLDQAAVPASVRYQGVRLKRGDILEVIGTGNAQVRAQIWEE